VEGKYTYCGCNGCQRRLIERQRPPVTTGTLRASVDGLSRDLDRITDRVERVSQGVYETRAGSYRARCSHCPWTMALKTGGAAEMSVREHARTCLTRRGLTAGKLPPEGWRQVGTLLASAGGTTSTDPLLQVAMDVLSRGDDFNQGGFLLLVDDKGRVVEGGEILHGLSSQGGPLVAYVRVAGPLAKAHPEGARVFVKGAALA
jgi:hypothetical protein